MCIAVAVHSWLLGACGRCLPGGLHVDGTLTEWLRVRGLAWPGLGGVTHRDPTTKMWPHFIGELQSDETPSSQKILERHEHRTFSLTFMGGASAPPP